ncbi:SMP-30/gluconolactonase/LRE family protein [Rugamonas sp.]|uniref:SMP-30/gluconolactonase/LRE family protein n=1 Tax=Rugamonas sp. TaxID=1926287 RepID=UPI0025EA9904|nr:SMP-30/gluconolactonase/LRE family protein [Rugamonas sp.]
MTTPTLFPELLWPLGAELGEGPMWHAAQQRLYFVDLKGHTLHGYDGADGRRHSWPMPAEICWLIARSDGDGFMAGLGNDIVRLWLEPAVRIEKLASPVAPYSGVRLNDAKADAAGNIWAGSMHDTEVTRKDGKLFRLGADGTLRIMVEDYQICNGPALSLDGTLLYHSDSLPGETHVYAIGADGTLGPQQLWRRFDGAVEGSPDGMTVDSEGCLWIAQWGGSRVCRYAPDGTLLATIAMPVKQPTSCVFGGPDLKTLYITSAHQGMDAGQRADDPLAGALFSVRLEVGGVPGATYG